MKREEGALQLWEFIHKRLTVCKWVGLAVFGIQVPALLLPCLLLPLRHPPRLPSNSVFSITCMPCGQARAVVITCTLGNRHVLL